MVQEYGQLPSGEKIYQYCLKNNQGIEIRLINFGGIITHILVPDKNGKLENINLNLPDLETYRTKNRSFGALVGRFANRIAGGKFSLNGKEYTLFLNNGPNSLHGGKEGFDKKPWAVKEFSQNQITLTYFSADGEEGYPGNLSVQVTYTLTDQNQWKIDYLAEADADTILNLTNHAYFNLSGDFSKTVLDHQIKIFAPFYLPVDKNLIPLGAIASVKNTAFDFQEVHSIGERIHSNEEQIQLGLGYDHAYVFDKNLGELSLSAEVFEPNSGRLMRVFTTEPGMQLYTGNHLDGSLLSENGVVLGPRSGFCLETQHLPDSPNQQNFPSTILKPGEVFRSSTVYEFSLK